MFISYAVTQYVKLYKQDQWSRALSYYTNKTKGPELHCTVYTQPIVQCSIILYKQDQGSKAPSIPDQSGPVPLTPSYQ